MSTEAKKRANKKWNDANLKEKYDRIQVVVPKGEKERIQMVASPAAFCFIRYNIPETLIKCFGV